MSSAACSDFNLPIPACIAVKEFIIIAFSGRIGAGKNYLSDECLSKWLLSMGVSYVSLAYADPLKFDAIEQRNFDFESVFITKPTKVRQALQEIGTRERQKDSNIWVKRLHSQVLLHLFRGIEVIVITDNRFPNECEYVKQVFGDRSTLIRVEAPERVEQKLKQDYTQYQKSDDGAIISVDEELTKQKIREIANHPSETALNAYSRFDLIVNNDFENESNSFQDLQRFLGDQPFFRKRLGKMDNHSNSKQQIALFNKKQKGSQWKDLYFI